MSENMLTYSCVSMSDGVVEHVNSPSLSLT